MKYFLVTLGCIWILLFCSNYTICQFLYKKNPRYISENTLTDSVNVTIIKDTSLSVFNRKLSYLILQKKYEIGQATEYEQSAINDFRLILWWGLKQNIYNVIMMLDKIIVFLVLLCFLPNKLKLLASIIVFGFMMCFANVVDRLYFDIKTFQTNDVVMIIFGIIFSTVFYFRCKKS